MGKTAGKNKSRYDNTAHAMTLEVGDRVLVRRLGPKVESKVDDRWEEDIFIVIEKVEDLPVYTVQREDGKGPRRTLHRNLLLPIGAISELVPERKEAPPRKTIKVPRQVHMTNDREEEEQVPLRVTLSWPTPLRANAPEFHPKSDQGTQVARESQNCLQPDEPTPENEPESGKESGGEASSVQSESDEKSGTEAEESEGKCEQSEEEDSAATESEEEEPEDKEPVLCRSNRERRPVNRLTLGHSVDAPILKPVPAPGNKTVRTVSAQPKWLWLDSEVVEAVQTRLNRLVDQPFPAIEETRVRALENVLNCLLHI
jgi:hypothetical protein